MNSVRFELPLNTNETFIPWNYWTLAKGININLPTFYLIVYIVQYRICVMYTFLLVNILDSPKIQKICNNYE